MDRYVIERELPRTGDLGEHRPCDVGGGFRYDRASHARTATSPATGR